MSNNLATYGNAYTIDFTTSFCFRTRCAKTSTSVSKCPISARSAVTTCQDRSGAYARTDTPWRRTVDTVKVRIKNGSEHVQYTAKVLKAWQNWVSIIFLVDRFTLLNLNTVFY